MTLATLKKTCCGFDNIEWTLRLSTPTGPESIRTYATKTAALEAARKAGLRVVKHANRGRRNARRAL